MLGFYFKTSRKTIFQYTRNIVFLAVQPNTTKTAAPPLAVRRSPSC